MIWRAAAVVLGLLLVVAAIPALRHVRETPPPPPPAVHLALTAPDGADLGAGDDILDAAVSPDSREIVFVATSNGIARLWVRALDAERAEPLKGTEGASFPAWKRTALVSFFADGKLKQVSRADGTVRELADAPAPAGAGWMPDGSLLFVPNARGPVRAMRDGALTDATTLKPGERGHAFPSPVEGGFIYVATLDSGARVIRLVRDGTERDLATSSSHAQLVDGRLVYVRDSALVAQRVDPDTAALVGRSMPLAFNVGVSPGGHGFFAVSPRLAAWAVASPRARELAWLDLDRGTVTRVGEPADYWQVRLSPDDFTAALTILDPLLRTLDVFVLPLTEVGWVPRRISLALAADSDPVWSPGSDRILYRSMQGGQAGLFAREARNAESREAPLLRSDLDETPSDWRNGTILFHAPGAGGSGLDIWSTDEDGRTPAPAVRSGFNELDARWSSDGRLLAYVSDESGRPDIYVEPWQSGGLKASGYPVPGMRTRISFGGGTRPEWGRDGRSLFFLRNGRLMRVDMAGRPETRPLQFTTAREAFDAGELRDYSLSHRGNRILAIVPRDRTVAPSAGVIVNW